MGKVDTCQVICHNRRILDYPTFHFNKHAEIKQLVYSKELGCLSEKKLVSIMSKLSMRHVFRSINIT